MKEKRQKRLEELNNKSIALNILYLPYNIEEIKYAYKSKHNLVRKNQVVLLMITDGKKSVKKLSVQLKGIKSKDKGDFYCLNCFHSYGAKDVSKIMKIYVRIMIITM